MYNNSIVESKERLIGLDIVRVISCFMILTFHTFYSLSLSYGFLDKYVEKGAIFVSVFFILSGFSLYYSNYKKNLSQIKEMKLFYKKRIIGILPAYFIAWIGFYIFQGNIYNISLHDIIRLFPIDFLGLRCELQFLPGMNYFWYISCLVIGYLVYPLINEIIKQINIKEIVALIVFIYGIICYSKYCEDYFEIGSVIYYTPFFRILEMVIGAFSCQIMFKIKDSKIKPKLMNKIRLIILITSIVSFVYFYKFFLSCGDKWLWYDIFIIPCTIGILANIDCIKISSNCLRNVICFFSGISYEIYLFQTWAIKFLPKIDLYCQILNPKMRRAIALLSIIILSWLINRLIRLLNKLMKRCWLWGAKVASVALHR